MFTSKCVLLNMAYTMAIFLGVYIMSATVTNDIYQIIDNSLHYIRYYFY